MPFNFSLWTLARWCLPALIAVSCVPAPRQSLSWRQLPSIPDATGFAAPFAGVSQDALLVAGGANFPALPPWAGGRKEWHRSIFVLPAPDAAWIPVSTLPRAAAYGVSVSWRDEVICAGGCDAEQHFRDVFALRWVAGRIETRSLPPLPRPLAYGCGALVGRTFYLAGGTDQPEATNALRNFWQLDLDQTHRGWQELEPWPGPARMLAVAGAGQGSFFLFSGVELSAEAPGKPTRRYLTDAYRYTPGSGWRRLCDLPRPAAAAPSPAIIHSSRLLIVSGDDGRFVHFEPPAAHPGFPREVLAYDPRADRWVSLGDSPLSRATVPVVEWRGQAVIPNGESRPGVRSPEVWAFQLR